MSSVHYKPSLYPHYFKTTIRICDFINKYNNSQKGDRLYGNNESLAGRVMLNRTAGSKLTFLTIQSDGYKLQIIIDKKEYQTNYNELKNINIGDIIGINGFGGKSLRDEISLYAKEIIILTPCLHHIPKEYYGIKDAEVRATQRYLDLMINKESRDTFIKRSLIITEIRKYLNEQNFIEVQTPILSAKVGGAMAKPFNTYCNDKKLDYYLRISPELHLKMLVVGGLDRVYEIGQQFRNESIDLTHNPEFTSLEFYMAYADYNILFSMCEALIIQIVCKVAKPKMDYTTTYGKVIEIDFNPPYKRIDMMNELSRIVGFNVPCDDSDETNKILLEICDKYNVVCLHPTTTARLLDKLVGYFIEPLCINPTFIYNHPKIMSPLAKGHRHNPQLTERFELFINGMEICNAYTELNDPIVQKERFDEQHKAKDKGDTEAHGHNEEFLEALKYGLPPTAGFGMGIDRLTMLMTNKHTIKDVILFPL